MLQALSPMVVVALTRAHEAREYAELARGRSDRLFWLEMERHWVKLAQSHQAQGRLGTYLRGLSLNARRRPSRLRERLLRDARQAAVAGQR